MHFFAVALHAANAIVLSLTTLGDTELAQTQILMAASLLVNSSEKGFLRAERFKLSYSKPEEESPETLTHMILNS